jgi:hypothetical protein
VGVASKSGKISQQNLIEKSRNWITKLRGGRLSYRAFRREVSLPIETEFGSFFARVSVENYVVDQL